jgi:uncharacterized membrane protein YdjX (TVP38/TMEM64 family)
MPAVDDHRGATTGDAGSPDVPERGRARASWTRVALTVVTLGALVFMGRRLGALLPGFAAWVQSLGAWGPVVFILGYATAVVALVPAVLLTLAAGAIFGVVWGAVWVFIAAVLGSAAAFLVSRYVARDLVARRLAANPRFAAVDRAVGREGRKIVFLLRLSPLFPFVLLNYALGLTTVRFADYLLAAVGMIPGTILYVYYGKLAGDVAALAGGAPVQRGTGYWLVLALGLVASVLVATLVGRTAKRALAEAVGT